MFKSLVVLAALAITAPGLAFADDTQQQNNPAPPSPPTDPGGQALLTVDPPGLSQNPHGPPPMPLVFGAGQPTGGCPHASSTGAATFTCAASP